jgi:hypothetical protein
VVSGRPGHPGTGAAGGSDAAQVARLIESAAKTGLCFDLGQQ